MKSQNFEFLRAKRPVLADLGGFAEHYAHTDPTSSLIKQRTFVEQTVAAIYDVYDLRAPYSDNLNDLLNEDAFKASVPDLVLSRLHAVRIAGNHAAHPRRPIKSDLALERLRATFEIAEWFHLQVDRGSRYECPTYQAPGPDTATNGKAKAALEQLRIAEARYEGVLAALEEERRKRIESEQAAAQLAEQARALSAEQKATQDAAQEAARSQLKTEGEAVASLLSFNEATTRQRLIDQRLIEAGWDVGPGNQDTEQVRREVELWKLPTESGHGFADYVLYGDDGKALAVVEAKRTAKDASLGAEQARTYAMGLEAKHGVRPVIFFTNGVDLYLWDDARYPSWRKIQGFYTKDSVEHLIHQRANAKALAPLAPNLAIADRIYQLEAIKRVSERFDQKFRRALIVQATGTGKTRVAVSVCELLMRAGWVKRILFLCDRRELRRQADRVFKEYLPGEPRVIVDAVTSKDKDKRIYLATYPAIMKCFETFDVGFFDLVIADESHRSIYKKFRAPFRYFDALQIGLTATPVSAIDKNTFGLFGCEDRDPTFNFGFPDALSSKPACLVPFRVRAFGSTFRDKGIKYSAMTAEQRAQADDQDATPQSIEYDPSEVDRLVFNEDMTRRIWKTLMDEGLREATRTRVGKTIVFARNHAHAMHLSDVFQKLYPQYGAHFCRVIDNQEPRAEQLIDDLKDPTKPLTIGISVDMLDTGIDIPEIVNLVFAKPVWSFVKFWQMIGRGTRLAPNLFGPGRHKTEFLIFDHWGNFEFFDTKYQEPPPKPPPKSLLQRLFEARLELADAALAKMEEGIVQATVTLLVEDVIAVRDTKAMDVQDRWREIERLSERERVAAFTPTTRAELLSVAAPLMHVRNIRGEDDAYRFDLLATQLETSLLRSGRDAPATQDLKARMEATVELLAKNQNPVKAKAAAIQRVQSKDFWAAAKATDIEELRQDLRGIMRFQQGGGGGGGIMARIIDIEDADETAEDYTPKLDGLDLVEYRHRVHRVIEEHFAGNPVLQKIRDGQPVLEAELQDLARLVMQVDDRANVLQLAGRDPATRKSLLGVFRSVVGLDQAAVERAFKGFVKAHGGRLSSQQLRFLQLLWNHIAQNGGIEIDRLYEAPFTTVHAESLDGVFTNPDEVEELLAILVEFEPKRAAPLSAPEKQAS